MRAPDGVGAAVACCCAEWAGPPWRMSCGFHGVETCEWYKQKDIDARHCNGRHGPRYGHECTTQQRKAYCNNTKTASTGTHDRRSIEGTDCNVQVISVWVASWGTNAASVANASWLAM